MSSVNHAIQNDQWSRKFLSLWTVEIMSVSQETGDRTKVAVRSHNQTDAIGTIVGRGGANIKKITSKFHPAKVAIAKVANMIRLRENIDVISEWVADQQSTSTMPLSAEVSQVIFHAGSNKRAGCRAG